MKKRIFISFFVGVHLLFIGFQIDKQSRLAKANYQKQQYEHELKKLHAQKQDIINRMHCFQNHQKIKSYAQTELKMTPLFLKKIKKISVQELEKHE